MLEVGKKHRTLVPDQNGEMHKLSDYAGKKNLYFYPKDNTPGCTEAGMWLF